MFLRSLSGVVNAFGGRLLVCWEGGHSPRRLAVLPTYKVRATAEYTPEKRAEISLLNASQPLVEQMLALLGVVQLRMVGLEGDDLVVYCALTQPSPSLIMSNDSDFYQLLSDLPPRITHQLRNTEDMPWTAADFSTAKGVFPYLWALYKSCTGDGSDCIPGVPGVGDKTALEACQQVHGILQGLPAPTFASLVAVVLSVAGSSPNKRVQKLLDHSTLMRNLELIDLVHAAAQMTDEQRRQVTSALGSVKPLDQKALGQWLTEHRMVSILAEWSRYVGPFQRVIT